MLSAKMFIFACFGACFLRMLQLATLAVNTQHWLNDGLGKKNVVLFSILRRKGDYKWVHFISGRKETKRVDLFGS